MATSDQNRFSKGLQYRESDIIHALFGMDGSAGSKKELASTVGVSETLSGTVLEALRSKGLVDFERSKGFDASIEIYMNHIDDLQRLIGFKAEDVEDVLYETPPHLTPEQELIYIMDSEGGDVPVETLFRRDPENLEETGKKMLQLDRDGTIAIDDSTTSLLNPDYDRHNTMRQRVLAYLESKGGICSPLTPLYHALGPSDKRVRPVLEELEEEGAVRIDEVSYNTKEVELQDRTEFHSLGIGYETENLGSYEDDQETTPETVKDVIDRFYRSDS